MNGFRKIFVIHFLLISVFILAEVGISYKNIYTLITTEVTKECCEEKDNKECKDESCSHSECIITCRVLYLGNYAVGIKYIYKEYLIHNNTYQDMYKQTAFLPHWDPPKII